MLIKCPECSHDLSDKAAFCPNCGYQPNPGKKYSKAKKMRLPNGFGRITRITGKNLRKPYRAMVTIGTDKNGRPIGKLLKPVSYFETYNEAYKALMEYSKSPFDLTASLTVKGLYDKWMEDYKKTISIGRTKTIICAWKYCSSIENIDIKVLKASQVKFVIDGESVPLNTKKVLKSVFTMMLDYAMERDLVDKNIAKSIKIGKEVTRQIESERKAHIPYTKEELDVLWAHEEDDLFITGLLIQCYSGWRPIELEELRIENIDLENWTMTGGAKTSNGRNRTVPIYSKIKPLVKKLYDLAAASNIAYLFVWRNDEGELKHFVRTSNTKRLSRILNALNLNKEHRFHDGRMTFITNAKNAEVNDYAIKRIVGHSITDLTENVYTIRDIEWLRKEIEKIP